MQCWHLCCRACTSEKEHARAAAMRKISPTPPSKKQCRKCDEVRPSPSLYTVVLTYVCPPSGRKATEMNSNAPRGHCSCYLLLDRITDVLQVKDVSQFMVNKSKLDGLHSYCHECLKMVKDEFNRGRIAPPESAMPPSKRCATCGEVSCHRLRCHYIHCTNNR